MFIEQNGKTKPSSRGAAWKANIIAILVSLETIGLVPPRWGLDFVLGCARAINMARLWRFTRCWQGEQLYPAQYL